MDITTSDFSLPPQWVLDLHDADAIPPHVFVTAGEETDSYIIQAVDFHKTNPYAAPVTFEHKLETKGEPEIFFGSKTETYEKLRSLDAKVILSREVGAVIADGYCAPMAYGRSSDFTDPALVCSSYREFLKANEAYEANREHAGLAYAFINLHPMFWHKIKDRRGEMEIVTGQGWGHLQWMVRNKKNKETGVLETTVTIETGQGSWHDYNLDVYAPSFDAAVIELAKLIHTHYDSHGGFTDKTKKGPNDNFFRDADSGSDEK